MSTYSIYTETKKFSNKRMILDFITKSDIEFRTPYRRKCYDNVYIN
jgi:hypothetical protein